MNFMVCVCRLFARSTVENREGFMLVCYIIYDVAVMTHDRYISNNQCM
jgi:hypothetical protein